MGNLLFPPEVEDVFTNFYTCEFTTLTRRGTPVAWPVMPIYVPDPLQFVILSPAALSQKADHLRRNPRVSLLFSESTGSGLTHPPSVLVQGEAAANPQLTTTAAEVGEPLISAFKAQTRKLLREQPAVRIYLHNPLTRYLMEWYFIRRMITITPRRILWWEDSDFNQIPCSSEVVYVG